MSYQRLTHVVLIHWGFNNETVDDYYAKKKQSLYIAAYLFKIEFAMHSYLQYQQHLIRDCENVFINTQPTLCTKHTLLPTKNAVFV